ncbi:MAG: riboflavin kinase, partial [Planctomycetales bacterium]|nr:riboflavin kinase [Planctomycetales bacterium]
PVGSAQAGFAAALNIGPSPTFADPDQKVEVHLIDYDGDLYGTELTVDFLDRLRDIQTFETVAQLQSQLNADVMAARQVCAGGEIR